MCESVLVCVKQSARVLHNREITTAVALSVHYQPSPIVPQFLLAAGWSQLLLAFMKLEGFALPFQASSPHSPAGKLIVPSPHQTHVCIRLRCFPLGWHGRCNVLKRTKMRLNRDRRESGCFRTNASHDSQKIKVGMSAPRMGIGARRLRVFRPRGQSRSHHLPPGRKQLEILISHVRMIERAC